MNAANKNPGRVGPEQARILVEAVHRLSGIAVSADKTDFIEHRLSRLLRRTGIDSVNGYIQELQTAPAGPAAQNLVEALTTHTTSFFRERGHFDWLEAQGFPALLAQGAGRARPLTIWSAACSTGAELWTAGMVLDTFARAREPALRWALIGTDVSQQILAKAALATFDEDDIRPIPEAMRQRYLLRSRAKGGAGGRARDLTGAAAATGGGTRYRISPELRRRARLAWANLLDLPAGLKISADVAFLRNVLIYFQPEDQLRAAMNVARRLQPGGYLLTGHAESLAQLPPGMTLVAPSIYRKT